MKKYFFVCLMFAGCSANNNDKMNKLLSEKKGYEDSLTIYENKEAYYNDLFRHTDNDTIKRNLYLDSTTNAYMHKYNAENRLKEISYSIDSLSKLK